MVCRESAGCARPEEKFQGAVHDHEGWQTENGHFSFTLLHRIFFTSGVVFLYRPYHLRIENVLATRHAANLQFNVAHASLKSELINDIMMRAS